DSDPRHLAGHTFLVLEASPGHLTIIYRCGQRTLSGRNHGTSENLTRREPLHHGIDVLQRIYLNLRVDRAGRGQLEQVAQLRSAGWATRDGPTRTRARIKSPPIHDNVSAGMPPTSIPPFLLKA